jgi:hypothetical protein
METRHLFETEASRDINSSDGGEAEIMNIIFYTIYNTVLKTLCFNLPASMSPCHARWGRMRSPPWLTMCSNGTDVVGHKNVYSRSGTMFAKCSK